MPTSLYRKFKKKTLFRPLQGGWQVIPSGGRYGGTLSGQFQQALDKANAANERRYQRTFMFLLPGSYGRRDAWDGIIRYEIDSRYRPCNLVELMPRLMER